MKVSIDKFSKVPVYLQIADQIKSQIISGALPRGSALPSERALAQILDVHRNTVVKAYSEPQERRVDRVAPGRGLHRGRVKRRK